MREHGPQRRSEPLLSQTGLLALAALIMAGLATTAFLRLDDANRALAAQFETALAEHRSAAQEHLKAMTALQAKLLAAARAKEDAEFDASAARNEMKAAQAAADDATAAAQIARTDAQVAAEVAKQGGGGKGDTATPAALQGRRVVVSLSTFAGRVEFVAPTIYSLTAQKVQPAAIYLWVALNVSRAAAEEAAGSEGEGKLPQAATVLAEQFPGLVHAQLAKDWGPATKLLPTLEVETDPDTIIVTVDDDVFYHPDTVGDVAEELALDPKHPAVRSCEETFEEGGKNETRWMLDGRVCSGFQTAYASAAYLRSMFPAASDGWEILEGFHLAPEGCRFHDDVFFAGMLWLNGYRPRVIQPHVHAWPPLYHRPYDRLSIQSLPDTRAKEWECLAHFGWLLDKHKPEVLRQLEAARAAAGAAAKQGGGGGQQAARQAARRADEPKVAARR